MDSIPHALRKTLVERAASAALPARTPVHQPDAPPAYTPTANTYPAATTDAESDPDDEDSSTIALTINASTTIKGSNNIVPTSSPLADATRFSAILLSAVQKLQAKMDEEAVLFRDGESRALKVHLVVNAGVTIVGERNVVGCVAVKRTEEEKDGQAKGGDMRKRGRNEEGDEEMTVCDKRVRME